MDYQFKPIRFDTLYIAINTLQFFSSFITFEWLNFKLKILLQFIPKLYQFTGFLIS